MTQPSQTPSPEAKTSIDSLIELLMDRGKLDLNTISATLGVSPTIVEGWVKVLENGGLVKVNYEVGKMYLEPRTAGAETEQGVSNSLKADSQRMVLQNEVEVEKIKLDKFSRTLDELSATSSGMETLYRQKLPNIQKLFSELDALSNPMVQKTKDLSAAQKAADSYFSQLDKKTDTLYAKIEALEGSSFGETLKQKGELLKAVLARTDASKAALLDLEDTRQALYGQVSMEIDRQVRDFKAGLKSSLDLIYGDLRVDALEATKIDTEIRSQLAATVRTAAEAESLKKEADASKIALMASRNSFKQSYQKITEELDRASRGMDQKYVIAQRQVAELKASLGEASRLYDSVTEARAQIEAVQKSLQASRSEVSSIMESLKMLDVLSKKMQASEKEKALSELGKKSMEVKAEGNRIKRSLEEADDSLKKEAEGKG